MPTFVLIRILYYIKGTFSTFNVEDDPKLLNNISHLTKKKIDISIKGLPTLDWKINEKL